MTNSNHFWATTPKCVLFIPFRAFYLSFEMLSRLILDRQLHVRKKLADAEHSDLNQMTNDRLVAKLRPVHVTVGDPRWWDPHSSGTHVLELGVLTQTIV